MDDGDLAYTIRLGRAADRDNINEFLRDHFYKHEPLNMSLGIPRGHTCTEGSFAMYCLAQGHTLVAVTAQDGVETIRGVCLVGECSADDDDLVMDPAKCDKYKKLIKFIVEVDERAEIWKQTGLTRCLDVHVLSVDGSLRRHGIARALVERVVKMAAEERWPLLTVTCTSRYSAGLMDKLGWKCLYALRYDEYLDEGGLPVFSPPPPHDQATVYALVL